MAVRLWGTDCLSRCVLPGTVAEVRPVGAEEGRVFGKAAGGAGCTGGFPSLEHGAGSQQPLDGHILPQGRAGGLMEKTADLGAAAEKAVCHRL